MNPHSFEKLLVHPVPRLLSVNDEPTAEEKALVLAAISRAKDEINSKGRLSKCCEDYKHAGALQRFIREGCSMISSIRRLPVELIREIIIYTVHDPYPDLDNPPYLLGHVCRLWRLAALSIPLLHSILPRLRLQKYDDTSAFSQHLLQVMPTVPFYSFQLSNISGPDIHPVANLYFRTSERWKHAFITADASALKPISTRLVRSNVPMLESLRLHIATSRYAGPCYAFENAPCLRTAEIECPTLFLLRLPWKQLTKYKERSGRAIGIPFIIYNGNPIEHLTYITAQPDSLLVHISKATLPRLTHLDIRLYHHSSISILPQLTLPSLQELRVRHPGTTRLFQNITNLVIRSGTAGSRLNLRRLAIYAKPPKPLELTHLLLRTPYLVELECNDIPSEDLAQIAKLIVYRLPGQRPLVPRLCKLTIYSPSASTFDSINKLIDNRSKYDGPQLDHSPLEVIRLVFADAPTCEEASSIFDVARPSNQRIYEDLSNLLTELDVLTASYKSGRHQGLLQALSDWRAGRKLDSLLSALESIKIDDPRLIEVRALSILKKFWLLDSCKIPQESKYHFIRRAHSLLDVWTAAFRSQPNVNSNRWIRHGLRSLLHLRARGDEDGRERDLIDGEYKFVDEPALFWPYEDHPDT
ncbi:hypothetical protein NLJ89_g4990 [Agrocybe chaxingu]|uniref:F-box domain-containing protein n=1 Tax=Agrocybe chaxingu TaxID=84603 RepID=A0A9W8JZE8_9AGAR|nr:hypothetical protein NLJ89_g4990 [Agrocybe chaxingu]